MRTPGPEVPAQGGRRGCETVKTHRNPLARVGARPDGERRILSCELGSVLPPPMPPFSIRPASQPAG